MPTDHISKKLPTSRIVWIAESNQWVHFEEPAWYVYSLIKKLLPPDAIARKCEYRYGLTQNEGLRFVNEISESLHQLEKPWKSDNDKLMFSDLENSIVNEPYSIRQYKLNNNSISISYDSKTAEYYIHPPLAHLQTKDESTADANFEFSEYNSKPVLHKKGDPHFTFSENEYSRLKRKLYIEISNIIYHKTNDHWMSFVHASGISNGKETILLSSSSGSGKSTMAALLQARGFHLASDDFIPIDARTKRAWPFPAAVSIKEGAFPVLSPFYENLNDRSYNLYPFTHPSLRFLHPMPYHKDDYKPCPVKTIIFIRYFPKVNCSIKRLSIPEALKLFHEQAWVSHNPAHARKFINWFVKLKCFTLEYSDNEKGIDAVIKRF